MSIIQHSPPAQLYFGRQLGVVFAREMQIQRRHHVEPRENYLDDGELGGIAFVHTDIIDGQFDMVGDQRTFAGKTFTAENGLRFIGQVQNQSTHIHAGNIVTQCTFSQLTWPSSYSVTAHSHVIVEFMNNMPDCAVEFYDWLCQQGYTAQAANVLPHADAQRERRRRERGERQVMTGPVEVFGFGLPAGTLGTMPRWVRVACNGEWQVGDHFSELGLTGIVVQVDREDRMLIIDTASAGGTLQTFTANRSIRSGELVTAADVLPAEVLPPTPERSRQIVFAPQDGSS